MGKSILFAAKEGAGKTYQAMGYYASMLKMKPDAKPAVLIDTEYKANLTLDTQFKGLKLEIIECQEFVVDAEKGQVDLDVLATLKSIRKEVRRTLSRALKNEISLIIFDSMMGLRTPFCQTEWELEKGKEAVSPDAWRQINDKVREIVFPLVNVAKLRPVDVLIMAPIIDRYEVIDKKYGISQIVGEELGVKDWLASQAQYIVELRKDTKKMKYFAAIAKSPRGMQELTHETIFNGPDVKWSDASFMSLYYYLL